MIVVDAELTLCERINFGFNRQFRDWLIVGWSTLYYTIKIIESLWRYQGADVRVPLSPPYRIFEVF